MDFVEFLLWYGGIPVSILASFIVARGAPGDPLTKTLCAASIFLATFAFSYLLFFAIFFRDGMAPGFLPSQGIEAIQRSFSGFQSATGAALVLAAPACSCDSESPIGIPADAATIGAIPERSRRTTLATPTVIPTLSDAPPGARAIAQFKPLYQSLLKN